MSTEQSLDHPRPLKLPGDIDRIALCGTDNITTVFAATELQKYVRKVTGQQLEVARERNTVDVARAFRLQVEGAGSDDGFELCVDSRKKQVSIKGANPRSLLFGVYRFLSKFLGVCWPSPNGADEILPPMRAVSLPAFRHTEHGLMKYRGFYIDTFQHSVTEENVAAIVDWMAKNYANYLLVSVAFYEKLKKPLLAAMKERGLILEVGHHGFSFYVDPRKHFKRHPEWFSMIDGVRRAGISPVFGPYGSQLCASNTELLDFYSDALKRYLDGNPEIDVLGIIPNDGFGWCECPDCRRLEENDAPVPMRDPLQQEDRVWKISSGRYHHLLNEVARRLRKGYSRRQFSFWAYAGSLVPTNKVRDLPPNFMLMIALYERWYNRALNERHGHMVPANPNRRIVNILGQWRDMFGGDISVYEYYAKYCWLSTPKWMPDIIRKDTRFLHQKHVQGLISMIESDNFLVYEPNHLAQLAMSWDGTVKAASWLDGYTATVFRTMSEPVKQRMCDVITLMRPFAMLGPPYPRRLTPHATAKCAKLKGEFRDLATAGRRNGYLPLASIKRLTTWSKNMEWVQQHFVLNRLYLDLCRAIAQKRYDEAMCLLTEWKQAKRRFRDIFLKLRGTGAVLGDGRWLGIRAFFETEDALCEALRAHISGLPAENPEAIVKRLRRYAC